MKISPQHLCCLGLVLLNMNIWPQESFSAASKESQSTMVINQQKVLEFLSAKVLLRQHHDEKPGLISGNLQYGYNRIDSGWLIYLHSPSDTPQTVEADIQLDMVTVRLITCIKDLLSKEYFRGYNLKIPLAPGQFRILHIYTESFEPDMEKYFQHPQSQP